MSHYSPNDSVPTAYRQALEHPPPPINQGFRLAESLRRRDTIDGHPTKTNDYLSATPNQAYSPRGGARTVSRQLPLNGHRVHNECRSSIPDRPRGSTSPSPWPHIWPRAFHTRKIIHKIVCCRTGPRSRTNSAHDHQFSPSIANSAHRSPGRHIDHRFTSLIANSAHRSRIQSIDRQLCTSITSSANRSPISPAQSVDHQFGTFIANSAHRSPIRHIDHQFGASITNSAHIDHQFDTSITTSANRSAHRSIIKQSKHSLITPDQRRKGW